MLALLAVNAGCVTVYQPLSGLQTPVVVDTEDGNFEDLKLVVHCVPRDALEGEAGLLCQNVKQLFENQGAKVKTVTSVGRMKEDMVFEEEDAGTGPDLIVELRARLLHEDTDFAMWTLSWLTMTLAPGISENSFSQEVVIRDRRGSLMFTGELKGRIVRYFGVGYWAANALMNWVAREDHEDIDDDNLSKALCGDMYGQLSQMVFNANMRRKVLSSGPTLGGGT